jgi:ABC-2 type transport system permease protein
VIRASLALARRALRNSLRRPQFLAPLVIFPSLFLAVNVGGLHSTTRLPQFQEVNGFLDFQLAAAITQSILLGGVTSGIAVALEIEGGFFDRLVASPVPRGALVAGRLIATAVLAVGQALWFLVIGLLFGAEIVSGVPGALLVIGIASLSAIGFGAIGMLLAFRAKNASTVQGIFPLVFVIIFLSSAFFPANLLLEPAKSISDWNPMSYIADGIRDPIISGISAKPVLEAIAAIGAVMAFGAGLSVWGLRRRLGG